MKTQHEENCQLIKINPYDKIERFGWEINLNDNEKFTNCYIIEISKNRTIIIDPGGQYEKIIEKIKNKRNKVTIILSHAHYDHWLATSHLQEYYEHTELWMHKKADYYLTEKGIREFFNDFRRTRNLYVEDRLLESFENGIITKAQSISLDNRYFFEKEREYHKFGDMRLVVLHTPGHSKDSISIYTRHIKKFHNNHCEGVVFVGDLMFNNGFGSLQNSNDAQQVLRKSYRNKILKNPLITDRFLILPGHGTEFPVLKKKVKLLEDYLSSKINLVSIKNYNLR